LIRKQQQRLEGKNTKKKYPAPTQLNHYNKYNYNQTTIEKNNVVIRIKVR